MVNNINGMGILFHPGKTIPEGCYYRIVLIVYCTTLGEVNLIHSLISRFLKLACEREIVTCKTQNAQSLEYSIKKHNSKVYCTT